jgi:hypothetical protein
MRVGIIGPARRRNGTGPFVARALLDHGADVVAVAASTPDSAAAAAARLGPAVEAYADASALLRDAQLDAVAICSPLEQHAAQLGEAIDAGVHVFCEKPLVWLGGRGEAALGGELLRRAADRGLVVHQNTQWRHVLEDVTRMLGRRLEDAALVEMRLSPSVAGLQMCPEAFPHVAAVLVALGATGALGDLQATWSHGLDVAATAARSNGRPLRVHVELRTEPAQPRSAWLAFDGTVVHREVLSMHPYRLGLRVDGRAAEQIEDPLDRSVAAFLARVQRLDVASRIGPIRAELQLLEALTEEAARAASSVGSKVPGSGSDGTRTRDLRRDRPAF